MRTFISFFLYSSLFSIFIGLSKNQCTLHFPQNVLLRPQIVKFSGARETRIDHCPCIKTLELKNGDYVIATCYLFDLEGFYNISRMTLQCVNNRAIEILSGNPMDSIELKCIRPPFHMHRATTIDNGYYEEFPWCPRSSLFFTYATADSTKEDVFTGVLCYDIRLSSTKVLYYEYVPWERRKILPPTVPATYVGEEHDNAVPKDQNLMLSRHYNNEEFRHWFHFGQFEYASTVPESVSEQLRENLSSLFNIMWWSYLRMGNWKRYQDKLREYVGSSGGMKILSGTFGEVRVPVNESGIYNQFVMSALKDDSGRKIFEYIWNDLESRQEGEKHVVIFGYNSPFYEFFPENAIVFCKSMCEEIEWLAGIQETFRYPNMGVIFCCLHEDVVKLNLIEGLGKKMRSPPDFEKPKGCSSSDENNPSKHEDDSQESNELDYPSDKSVNSSFEWGKLKLTKVFGKKMRSPPDCENPKRCSYSDENDSSEDEDLDNSQKRNQLDNGSAESVESSFEQGGRRKGCGKSCHDGHRFGKKYVKSGKKLHQSDHHGKGCHKCHQKSCRSGNHPYRRDHHCRNSDESYEDSRERNQLDNEWDESTECSRERTHRHRDCAESGKNSHRSGHHGKGYHKFHQESCRSGNHPHRRGHHCTNSDESYEDLSEEDRHIRHAHKSGLRERNHHDRNSDESHKDLLGEDQHNRNAHESGEDSRERNHHGRNSDESHEDLLGEDQHNCNAHESGEGSRERNHHGRNSDESHEDSPKGDQHNRNAHESGEDLRERNHHGGNSDESHEDSPKEDQVNRNAHESGEGSRERNHHDKNSDETHEDPPEGDQHNINAHESGEDLRARNHHGRNSDESHEDSPEEDQRSIDAYETGEGSGERNHHGRNSDESYEDSSEGDQHNRNSDKSYEDSREKGQHKRNAHESGEGSRKRNHHSRNSDESYEDSSEEYQRKRHAHESWKRNHHGRNWDESYEDSWEEDQYNRYLDESFEDSRELWQDNYWDELTEKSPSRGRQTKNLAKSRQERHQSGNDLPRQAQDDEDWDESHKKSRKRHKYDNVRDDLRHLDEHDRKSHDRRLGTNSHRPNHHGRDYDKSYRNLGRNDLNDRKRSKYAKNRNQR